MSPHSFQLEWIDRGREPQCQPDPRYPDGVDLDISGGRSPTCIVPLPYPARRCGLWRVSCDFCGVCIAVTTAGRKDDPRSVRIACEREPKTKVQ